MQKLVIFSTLQLIFAGVLTANNDDDIARCLELHGAVDRMELGNLYTLVQTVDANCKNSFGQTTLHRYARLRNADHVFYGLYYGGNATLDAIDNTGVTPLMTAAANGNVGTTQMLLGFATPKNPINVNAKDHEGRTPLHHAVLAKKPDVVKILLKEGSSALRRDNSRLSALMHARKLKDKKSIKLLEKAVKIQLRATKKRAAKTPKLK